MWLLLLKMLCLSCENELVFTALRIIHQRCERLRIRVKSEVDVVYRQWLKCKIRGGGTLHSGVGPREWLCAFPSAITI